MDYSRIGEDEWVAQAASRHNWRRTPLAWLQQRATAAHPLALVALFAGLAALLPLVAGDYVLHVAGTAWLYALLTLGLNIVVGDVRLLDLGYAALAGVGAYAYALLTSGHLSLQAPPLLGLAGAVGVAASCGLLLGLPALRLSGDHLAIVSLGFAQVFLLLTLNLDRVALPGGERLNLTGGPDGIIGVPPVGLFGWEATGPGAVYLVLLAALVAVLILLIHLRRSRLGRAWRAIGENELAAAATGTPVRRLKLLAVVVGSAVAGLTGGLIAARQGAVFPANFDLSLLLTLYAGLLLGGMGSLPGAMLGAVIVAALPEVLRDPLLARMLVYGGAGAAVLANVRPWPRALVVLISAGGLATIVPGLLGALPGEIFTPRSAGNLAFIAAAGLGLGLIVVRRAGLRLVMLPPALALALVAWELRLVHEPSITRMLVFGAVLVVLTAVRPQGLLGRTYVEVG